VRRRATGLMALLLGSGCWFAPDIDQHGYTSCEEAAECGPGRHCEHSYCMPAPWWDDVYSARYQLLIENPGSVTVPAASLGEVLVGEDADLTLDQVGYAPVIVYEDRAAGEHAPAIAMRDPRGDNYSFVFALPVELSPRAVFGDLWLYVGGDLDQASPSYSAPEEVYAYYEPFDGEALDSERFRWEGGADLGGGQLVLRASAWLVTEQVFEDQQVEVDLQLYGAACGEFGLGLAARHTPQSLDPPYAMFIADSTGQLRHEIWSSTLAAVEIEGETLVADGFPHRFSIAIAGDQVEFAVDQRVTATWQPEFSLADTALHLHIYTRDCDVRLETIRAAPRPVELPEVTLGERVVWSP